MTKNYNAKFEGKLTFHFKTDMRNLTKFDSNFRKSKKLLFNLPFNYPRKLSSFLQCSVHLFPGRHDCFNNFLEPYHEELSDKA